MVKLVIVVEIQNDQQFNIVPTNVRFIHTAKWPQNTQKVSKHLGDALQQIIISISGTAYTNCICINFAVCDYFDNILNCIRKRSLFILTKRLLRRSHKWKAKDDFFSATKGER